MSQEFAPNVLKEILHNGQNKRRILENELTELQKRLVNADNELVELAQKLSKARNTHAQLKTNFTLAQNKVNFVVDQITYETTYQKKIEEECNKIDELLESATEEHDSMVETWHADMLEMARKFRDAPKKYRKKELEKEILHIQNKIKIAKATNQENIKEIECRENEITVAKSNSGTERLFLRSTAAKSVLDKLKSNYDEGIKMDAEIEERKKRGAEIEAQCDLLFDLRK